VNKREINNGARGLITVKSKKVTAVEEGTTVTESGT
jgi:hypothetical protein